MTKYAHRSDDTKHTVESNTLTRSTSKKNLHDPGHILDEKPRIPFGLYCL